MENKTYILLKDLPDAHIGTEVFIDEIENCAYYQKSAWVTPYRYNYLTIATVTQSPEFFMEKSEWEVNKTAIEFDSVMRSPAKTNNIEFAKRIFMVSKPAPMEKKILGYKCPMDMFDSLATKGDLYIKEIGGTFYANKRIYESGGMDSGRKHALCCMPSEVVEAWEPVYEELPLEELYMVSMDKKLIEEIIFLLKEGYGYANGPSNLRTNMLYYCNKLKSLLNQQK